jgi:hypothetical protein
MELGTTSLDDHTVRDVRLRGNANFRSEQLHDFEVGYRAQWTRKLSLDATAYPSFYRRSPAMESEAPQATVGPAGVRIEQLLSFGNLASARDYKGEVAWNWTIDGRWRVAASYALPHLNPRLAPGSTDSLTESGIRSSLGNQAGLRADSRLGWRLGKAARFSVVGQNLVRGGHSESETPRGWRAR